jgi:hypothetical protein
LQIANICILQFRYDIGCNETACFMYNVACFCAKKVGTLPALTSVILLSQGSPSQLTLLVNLFCSHISIANHGHCGWLFFICFFMPEEEISYQIFF